jgi:Tfp pilus assembly protein FimT
MMELMTVTAVLMLSAGLATFGLQSFMRSYRAQSDARSIASQVSMARMRASSAFRDTRVVFDLAARTYQMQVMVDRVAGTWTNEGGAYFLSPDVTFGTGGAPNFTDVKEPGMVQQPQNIQFNTRSIPVVGLTPTPYAIYVTNSAGLTYAVTVSQTGRVTMLEYVESQWKTR